MGLLSLVQEQFISQALQWLAKDPEKSIGKVLNWCEALALKKDHKDIIANIKPNLLDYNSNWYKLVLRFLQDTSSNCQNKFATNFIANASLLGVPKQNKNAEKHGFSIPWALLIDPTENCNLKCKGCWAADYEKGANLEFSLLDRIITEAKALGTYFFGISGGEPLTRKTDLLALAKKHSDAVFFIFTNGTLIDETFAQEVSEAGNIVFAISIEGLEKATDNRRGKGVFAKVMQAMDRLHRAGVVFGFSATYTRQSLVELMSDEFIDLMIEKGCFFGWFFTYVPVGMEIDLEYMATPDQRAQMYERIKYFRNTKSIFVLDFWNDGEAVEGCIAGGRYYLHINASGDVEPCAFIHYSTCNIKDHSLLEALASPLFKAYQEKQPFNENHLCPCPLIDNPQALADVVHESGAHSTQKSNSVNPQKMADLLKPYAKEWQKVANKLGK